MASTHESSRPEASIEINLGRLQQLFDSLDPSPFHDRDLDHDAEEYIVGWAEEIALPRPLKLVIHLPQTELAGVDRPVLEHAIHNYFGYQQWQCQRRLRLLLRDGRISLAIGVAFLFVCIVIRQLAYSFGWASEIVAEGLLIVGWVAMWRPLQIFLYDWWPIARRRDLYRRLSTAMVQRKPYLGTAPVRARSRPNQSPSLNGSKDDSHEN